MNKKIIQDIVARALTEDSAAGDITTMALVPKDHHCAADLVFKSNGVLCGIEFARAAFKNKDLTLEFHAPFKDGTKLRKGSVIAKIRGKTRTMLTCERVAINFLTYLSSIATNTALFVRAVKPYKSVILDTRKTTPSLRLLERYGVRMGGGVNHRFDLSDAAMIKDNHYIIDKDPRVLVEKVKKATQKKVVLEVDNLRQLRLGLSSRADVILLDNMTITQTRQAVAMRGKINPGILLESSGGITLENAGQYAACGVERISVGKLTQQRLSIDISLDFSP